MELRARTEALFNRFTQTGTLGAGAERSKLGFSERAEAASYPLALDMLASYDNVTGLDKDDRAGFVRFDRATVEARMSGEIEQGWAQLIGPTPELDDATKDRMREEFKDLVTQGVLTQEELDSIMSDKPVEAPKNGELHGSMEKKDGTLRAALTSTGDQPDIEYLLMDGNGFSLLTVTPGFEGFTAKAIHLDQKDEANSYKETFSGSWNLIGA